MKLTKKEDYTFFVISMLARNYQIRLIPLSEIAEKYHISVFFLKQLVRPLVKAKIIKSKEGIGGGYALAKPPADITMYEVFYALNTLPKLTACCSSGKRNKCERASFCRPSTVWGKINKSLINELEKTKISALI